MYRVILNHIKSALPLFGTLGGIGGFVADILQPVAPFSNYVFFISLGLSFVLLLVMYARQALREILVPYLIFSASSMLFTGLLLGLGDDNNKANGVLASTFPALGVFQESLGLIQKDIEIIKEATEEIKQSSAQTAKNTEKIAESLAEMQKGFSSLTQSGGVIANPERPEQFYHNARIYELSGDYGNARRSYSRYFSFKLDLLDPHIRYQTFLKVQEGRAGALEIYSDMYDMDNRMIVEFARILLFDSKTRIQLLDAFIKKYPDFAPAYYELSREYSESRKGIQSLDDKKNEGENLEAFIKLNNEGQFLKYFIDNELAAQWIDDAERRIIPLRVSSKLEPLQLKKSSWRKNNGWSLFVSSFDMGIREIFYKTTENDTYISTGFQNSINPNTGENNPDRSIRGIKQPETEISIKYIDINNKEIGPFVFTLNANDFIIEKTKFDFEKTSKDKWVNFTQRNYTQTTANTFQSGAFSPEFQQLDGRMLEIRGELLKLGSWCNNSVKIKNYEERCKPELKEELERIQKRQEELMFEKPTVTKTQKSELNISFRTLIMKKCGLTKIEYGVDRKIPNESLPFELCKSNSMISRNNNDKSTLLKMPLDTDFITVKIYYKDGTASDIKTYLKSDHLTIRNQ